MKSVTGIAIILLAVSIFASTYLATDYLKNNSIKISV